MVKVWKCDDYDNSHKYSLSIQIYIFLHEEQLSSSLLGSWHLELVQYPKKWSCPRTGIVFVRLNYGWKLKFCVLCFVHLQKATPWLSVPQFGDWDQKGGALPDYSMDFSKIREMRKQNKRDPSRASLGNEEELISSATSNSNNAHSDDHHHFHQNNSPTVRFLVQIFPW